MINHQKMGRAESNKRNNLWISFDDTFARFYLYKLFPRDSCCAFSISTFPLFLWDFRSNRFKTKLATWLKGSLILLLSIVFFLFHYNFTIESSISTTKALQHKKTRNSNNSRKRLKSIKRFFINHIEVDFSIISEIIECFHSSSLL